MNRNNMNSNTNNNNSKTPNKNVSAKALTPTAKVPKTKRKVKTKSKTDTNTSDVINESVVGKQHLKSTGDINKNMIIPNISIDDRPDLKKIGRSNSFFLARKLSKLITTITGSRENINEVKEEKAPPPVPPTPELPFKFTRSRSMITLRKSTRRSVLEAPQLEKLTEESEHCKSPVESIAQDPPASPGIFESLKRTFSNSSEKRRSVVNPRWSASLQNLQEIDNMVSYEDLSFVNYDKFNEYEKHLEKRISQHDLTAVTPEMPPPPTSVVVRRRKKTEPVRKLGATSLSNIEGNFDRRKNLYRQSIDEEKLQHMNDVQRDSYRWSLGDEVDGLSLRSFRGDGASLRRVKSSRIEGCVEPKVELRRNDSIMKKRSVSFEEMRRKVDVAATQQVGLKIKN